MKKLCSLIICVMALLFAGCEPNAPATSSKVETGAASDITTESVVLHGKVNVDISQYEDVEFGMMVSEDKAELNARDGEMYKAKVLIGKDFKLTLEGLSPETKYYYSAWVFLNNTQYEFGVIKEFTTLAAPKIDGIGVFSVSADKQVTFSSGNLQYTQSTNTWSFAENQWDYIGTDNVTGGSVSSGQYGDKKAGDALADKIDLFGWSTGATHFGVSTSTDYNDYSGSFVDWGRNKIGNDAPNTWRTLSKDEWVYLFNTRTNSTSLYGVAQVNGVNGMVVLPDNWTCPEGITFKSGLHSYFVADYSVYQSFTSEQWSRMEQAGAVFLPASGLRWGTDVNDVGIRGYYSSSTENDENRAYDAGFYSLGLLAQNYGYRSSGISVRLVKDL